MRITVWSTFISEMNPPLKGMSDESRSSAEGDGDDELVVLVEIKLADVIYDSSAHQHTNSTQQATQCQLFISKIRMHISTSIRHITFPTDPQPQTSQRPSFIQPHHQVSLATQILHSQKTPSSGQRKYHAPAVAQPLNPPSIDDTTQIRDLRRLSVLEFDIQPTHSLPPFLVSMGSSSSTAPATSLSTQPLKPRWPPNTGSIRNKFNTIISTR